MAKSLWMKKALAYFGIALFVADTGSDSYVGGSLISRCHFRYGGAVFSFFWLPGTVYILGH